MTGKFIVQDWVSLMSLIQPLCEASGSTLTAITLTFRFSNSALIFATVPSSVVQTGVKSAGCENKTPHELPSQLWKSIDPSVVIAVKFGDMSPNRNDIYSFLLFKRLTKYSAVVLMRMRKVEQLFSLLAAKRAG